MGWDGEGAAGWAALVQSRGGMCGGVTATTQFLLPKGFCWQRDHKGTMPLPPVHGPREGGTAGAGVWAEIHGEGEHQETSQPQGGSHTSLEPVTPVLTKQVTPQSCFPLITGVGLGSLQVEVLR